MIWSKSIQYTNQNYGRSLFCGNHDDLEISRTTDLTFYWQQSLDRAEMDGDSTVCQKFAVSLKSKADDQNQGKLPDPYFNSESSIWSKISLNYTDETFRIFVSNLSRHQYESIYRLIGIISK